jgi:hypothetical protein
MGTEVKNNVYMNTVYEISVFKMHKDNLEHVQYR